MRKSTKTTETSPERFLIRKPYPNVGKKLEKIIVETIDIAKTKGLKISRTDIVEMAMLRIKGSVKKKTGVEVDVATFVKLTAKRKSKRRAAKKT